MKKKGMSRLVCYNVQSAVDSKHHLIVTHEVTNKTDRRQLCQMAEQAQDALKEKEIIVIADKGYYSNVDIKNCQDKGIAVLVPKTDTSASEKKDIYLCPANKELTYRLTSFEKGVNIKRYFLNVYTCRAFNLKPQCTRNKQNRRIRRWEHEEKIEQMEDLITSMPDSMLIRKSTVEHPFGTIKSWMGSTHFLTRRFKNVSTEMNLHILAYNRTRMIKIMGVQGLIGAIQAS